MLESEQERELEMGRPFVTNPTDGHGIVLWFCDQADIGDVGKERKKKIRACPLCPPED